MEIRIKSAHWTHWGRTSCHIIKSSSSVTLPVSFDLQSHNTSTRSRLERKTNTISINEYKEAAKCYLSALHTIAKMSPLADR